MAVSSRPSPTRRRTRVGSCVASLRRRLTRVASSLASLTLRVRMGANGDCNGQRQQGSFIAAGARLRFGLVWAVLTPTSLPCASCTVWLYGYAIRAKRLTGLKQASPVIPRASGPCESLQARRVRWPRGRLSEAMSACGLQVKLVGCERPTKLWVSTLTGRSGTIGGAASVRVCTPETTQGDPQHDDCS